jgi:hypothetical protein
MQAISEDGTCVFGAVGFQNSVTDSSTDKRNAAKKFKEDLQAAILEKPDLKFFVFFTNVDLTPGEVDELRSEAAKNGVAEVDIYWRERIRNILDSPVGLGLRYQYLKLPLSAEEQAAFFNSYNAQLEELILRQHEHLDKGVRRLEFLHWMSHPLRQLQLDVRLNQFVTADIGTFRVLARLSHPPMTGTDGWYIGGGDRFIRHSVEEKELLLFGTETVYSAGPEVNLRLLSGTSVHTERVRDIHFGVAFRQGVRPLPEILDGAFMQLFATSNIAKYTSSVELVVNGYILARMARIAFRDSKFNIEWPAARGGVTESVEFQSGTSEPMMLPQITLDQTPLKSRAMA